MKGKELLEFLSKLTPEQLELEVLLHDEYEGEWFGNDDGGLHLSTLEELDKPCIEVLFRYKE